MNLNYKTDTRHDFSIAFSNNIRHESPVRDYQRSVFKKDEEFKDHYDVSNFKFPEVTTVYRTNQSNFCELSFDGTKTSKHHHRRKNPIKRVTSATTINRTTIKEEEINEKGPVEEEKIIEDPNKDTTITFHNFTEQLKKKLKFIDTPIKLHKNVISKRKEMFEVILSPKAPKSYSSVETILQSSDHRHKKFIVTSKTFHNPSGRPDMHDREIQTAIIGIKNINPFMDECFNMKSARMQSISDIFYNMDILPKSQDLFHLKQKKRKNINLTMTNFPCVEIKCSSFFVEMPANTKKVQMPRRTIHPSKSIEDYAAKSKIEEKVSEYVSDNSCEAAEPLRDKIFSLFNDPKITNSNEYNQKINDLCGLIGNLLAENKSHQCDKKIKKSADIPGELLINITKMKPEESNRQNASIIPSYSAPKVFHKNKSGGNSSNSSNRSTPRNRPRSVSPPSRPRTPCQIFVAKSNNQIIENSESNESTWKKVSFGTSMNTSTESDDGHLKNATKSEKIQTPQHGSTVPRNVFMIPPHVNELLKKKEYNTTSNLREVFGDSQKLRTSNSTNTKPYECQLINILKKAPIQQQSWVVPDIESKSQPVRDSVNTKNTKQKKTDSDFVAPSVTFSSLVDVFAVDNDSLEERMCPMSNPKTFQNKIVPVTGFKKSKTCSNKPEFYTNNDREEINSQNCGLYTVRNDIRQNEHKLNLNFEKQASFFNSNCSTTTSCLQKRKEYDNRLKMQLQMQNKPVSKIPLLTRVIEQENNAIKNQTSTKSKLPLKVTNEVTIKNINYKTNVQQFSKPTNFNLYTTDIKDTPFSKLRSENTPRKQESQVNTPSPTSSILKNSQKYIENNLNVTKDVSNSTNQEKQIIFIKFPEPNFHKVRNKSKVDFENIDNNSLEQMQKFENHNKQKNSINKDSYSHSSFKLTDSTFLSIPEHTASMELIRLQIENMKREKLINEQKSFYPHKNVLYVYQSIEESFSKNPKNDSLSTKKKNRTQIQNDEKKNRTYSSIYEKKSTIFKHFQFKTSLSKMKRLKINKVTFVDPIKWASLCKIEQYNKCVCDDKSKQKSSTTKKITGKKSSKCRQKSTNNGLKSSISKKTSASNARKFNIFKKKSSCHVCQKTKKPLISKMNLTTRHVTQQPEKKLTKQDNLDVFKTCCDNLCSGFGRQKENNGKDDKTCFSPKIKKSHKDKYTECSTTCGNKNKQNINSENNFKQMKDNLIACCTILCCKVPKSTSVQSIPNVKKCKNDCKKNDSSKVQKVYRVNLNKKINTCLQSTSKGVLTKRKKFNLAWKFKELIYDKNDFLRSLPKMSNNLYNIIKYVKTEKENSILNKTNDNKKSADINLLNENSKQIIKIFPTSKNNLENTLATKTTDIESDIRKFSNSFKNIKVINKGRFSTKLDDTIKNGQNSKIKSVSIISKKMESSIFIPTSPRKKIVSSKKENTIKNISTFPRKCNDIRQEVFFFSKKENTLKPNLIFPKTINDLRFRQHMTTFPWKEDCTLKNISISPKTMEDLRLNVPSSSRKIAQNISTPRKRTDRPVQNDVEQNANKTLQKKDLDTPVYSNKLNDINTVSVLPRKRSRNIYPVIFDTTTRKLYENRKNVPISPRQINKDVQNVPKYNNIKERNKLKKKISNTKFQKNEKKDTVFTSPNKMEINNKLKSKKVLFSDNESTTNIIQKECSTQNETKTGITVKDTKLPISKARNYMSHVNTKLLTRNKNVENNDRKPIYGNINTKPSKTKNVQNKFARRFVTVRKRHISKLVIETNEIVHIPDDDIISIKSKGSRESKSTDYKSVDYSRYSSNSEFSISSNSRSFFSKVGKFFRRYTKKVKKKDTKSMNENG